MAYTLVSEASPFTGLWVQVPPFPFWNNNMKQEITAEPDQAFFNTVSQRPITVELFGGEVMRDVPELALKALLRIGLGEKFKVTYDASTNCFQLLVTTKTNIEAQVLAKLFDIAIESA